MKSYLFRATDKSGKRETAGREAASIEHLRMVLEREGYRDIEFLDDEHSAELRQRWSPEQQPRTQAQFQFLANLQQQGRRRSTILIAFARNNAGPLLVLAALFVYGLYRQDWRWIVGPLCGIAALLWLVTSRMKSGNAYDELLKAHARGDIAKVEELTRKMQAMPEIQAKENILIDLQFRQAVNLARQGRFEEGLKLVEPLRNNPTLTKGMFESRTASIYYSAGRIADFVRLMEQAYEASGRAQMQALDFAFTQARFGDVEKAKQLLAGIEPRNLRAMHSGVFKAAEGACLLRGRNYPEASARLGEAVETIKPLAASVPTWPFQGIIAGYAAIAFAKNGQRDAARSLLAPWQQVTLTCIDPLARKLIQAEVLG